MNIFELYKIANEMRFKNEETNFIKIKFEINL